MALGNAEGNASSSWIPEWNSEAIRDAIPGLSSLLNLADGDDAIAESECPHATSPADAVDEENKILRKLAPQHGYWMGSVRCPPVRPSGRETVVKFVLIRGRTPRDRDGPSCVLLHCLGMAAFAQVSISILDEPPDRFPGGIFLVDVPHIGVRDAAKMEAAQNDWGRRLEHWAKEVSLGAMVTLMTCGPAWIVAIGWMQLRQLHLIQVCPQNNFAPPKDWLAWIRASFQFADWEEHEPKALNPYFLLAPPRAWFQEQLRDPVRFLSCLPLVVRKEVFRNSVHHLPGGIDWTAYLEERLAHPGCKELFKVAAHSCPDDTAAKISDEGQSFWRYPLVSPNTVARMLV